MQETTITSGPETKPSAEGLNTVFGLPESFRKMICAGLIAGTALFAGCAKSLEERTATIDNLSSPPISVMIENPKWFAGTEVALRGTPKFVSDISFTETTTTPVYTSKTVIAIPVPVTHKLMVYQLHEKDGAPTGIYLNSSKELPESELKISGKVLHQHGKAVLEVIDFLPAEQLLERM